MRKNIFLLLALGLFVYGCTEDSALSDVEISDPSIITPYIKLSRSIDENNNFNSSIEVWLYDKNGNSIELKKGEVRLNHVKLGIKIMDLTLTKAPYYSGDNVINNLELNTDYSFEIELSDGMIYNASIQTQGKDLTQLTLPSDYSINNDMDISWSEIYIHEKMEVQLSRYSNPHANGAQNFTTIDIPADNISKGSFTITKDNFEISSGDYYKAVIAVSGETTGTVDNRFHSNGQIISVYSIAKEISLN